jgi:hypothetical protein
MDAATRELRASLGPLAAALDDDVLEYLGGALRDEARDAGGGERALAAATDALAAMLPGFTALRKSDQDDTARRALAIVLRPPGSGNGSGSGGGAGSGASGGGGGGGGHSGRGSKERTQAGGATDPLGAAFSAEVAGGGGGGATSLAAALAELTIGAAARSGASPSGAGGDNDGDGDEYDDEDGDEEDAGEGGVSASGGTARSPPSLRSLLASATPAMRAAATEVRAVLPHLDEEEALFALREAGAAGIPAAIE